MSKVQIIEEHKVVVLKLFIQDMINTSRYAREIYSGLLENFDSNFSAPHDAGYLVSEETKTRFDEALKKLWDSGMQSQIDMTEADSHVVLLDAMHAMLHESLKKDFHPLTGKDEK